MSNPALVLEIYIYELNFHLDIHTFTYFQPSLEIQHTENEAFISILSLRCVCPRESDNSPVK